MKQKKQHIVQLKQRLQELNANITRLEDSLLHNDREKTEDLMLVINRQIEALKTKVDISISDDDDTKNLQKFGTEIDKRIYASFRSYQEAFEKSGKILRRK